MIRNAVVSALVAGVVSATAVAMAGTTGSVPHVFGHGGSPPTLDANCHRNAPIVLHAGRTWRDGGKQFVFAALDILANQGRCEVRLQAHERRCFSRDPIPEVVARYDHGPGKPADWLGVDNLRDRIAAIRACVLAAKAG